MAVARGRNARAHGAPGPDRRRTVGKDHTLQPHYACIDGLACMIGLGYSPGVPSRLRGCAVRPLMRWHATRALPSGLLVIAVTALSIVGSLLLDEGVNASATQLTTQSAAQRTASVLPAGPIVALATAGSSRNDTLLRASLLSGELSETVGIVSDANNPSLLAASERGAQRDRGSSPSALRVDRHRRRSVRWYVAPTVTWYGPGFYGNRTACGVRYGRYLRGLAHRSLPCGTMIRLRWGGRTTTVPVVDRGPYGNRRIIFDLTAAVACRDLRPRGVRNSCFTRHNVHWRIVGRVRLSAYFRARRR
jgi:rare lipoprotein A (peptidoglycan hydrolase)